MPWLVRSPPYTPEMVVKPTHTRARANTHTHTHTHTQRRGEDQSQRENIVMQSLGARLLDGEPMSM